MDVRYVLDGVLKAMYPQIRVGWPGWCAAVLFVTAGVVLVVYGLWRLWCDDSGLGSAVLAAMGLVAIIIPCRALHESARERRAARAKLCEDDPEVAVHVRLVQEHLKALEAIRLARSSLDTEAALRMERIREDTKWLDKNYRIRKEKGD